MLIKHEIEVCQHIIDRAHEAMDMTPMERGVAVLEGMGWSFENRIELSASQFIKNLEAKLKGMKAKSLRDIEKSGEENESRTSKR